MAWRKIDGARVLVTGTSSGIGRDLAIELAEQGARLIITARREERVRDLAEELRERGTEVHVVIGDVTDAGTRDELIDVAKREFGALDILINNAGIGAIGPFVMADEERMRRVMEVNFFAPAELIRAAVPLLLQGTNAMIVNVSSVLGHRAIPKKSEYCASKFALHGLSDSLRCELGRKKIDVLLVSPSTTESEFFDNVIDKQATLPWLKFGGQASRTVARKAVRAMRWGSHEIILTPGGKALVWADRLCPWLVNHLMARFA